MKKILIIFLLIFLITGCANKIVNEELTSEDVIKFKQEYEQHNNGIPITINEDDKIKYASCEEVLNLLKNGTGIIYFGRPTCPYCRNAVPVILEVAKENSMFINYLNPGEVPNDQLSTYMKIREVLIDYLLYNEEGKKTLYVPDVYFVKKGKIIGHHLGTVYSQEDAYIPLTSDQKQELKNIYQNYINELKG